MHQRLFHHQPYKHHQICRDLSSDSKSNNQNYKNDSWEFCDSIEDSALDSHAVLVLTEWEEFKNIDWYKLSELMQKPSWIFDTRLCIDSKDALAAGFNYWRLGLQ